MKTSRYPRIVHGRESEDWSYRGHMGSTSRSTRHLPGVTTKLLTATAILMGSVLVLLTIMELTPSLNNAGLAASVLLSSTAPWCVVAALVALTMAWLGRRAERASRIAAILTTIGLVLPLTVCVTTPVTVRHAGGTVNPLSALHTASMASPPDEVLHDTPRKGQSIQVYRPHSPGPHPVLVDIHGGGWNTDAKMPAVLRSLADAGWVVVRPSYPLSTPTRATWEKAPEAVACSWAWAGTHADRLHADTSSMVIMGDSAGGQLAINLSYQIAQGTASTSCGKLHEPAAVIGLYPALDLTQLASLKALGINHAATEYLGGTPEQYPDRYRDANSVTWVSPKAPRTFIVRGGRDTLVPPSGTDRFVIRARAAGADVTDVKIPLLDHAFDSQTRNSLGYQSTVSVLRAWLAQVR